MRNNPRSVMLFAAGFGTRMGALTADRPKPLIDVAGKPLIDHALHFVSAIEPEQIVVNLHYRPEMIQSHLAGHDVQFSLETPDILETGGGLRHALPLLGDGPVYTMNTDAVWRGPNPLVELAAHWDPTQMEALLLCIPPSQAHGHSGDGDFIIDTDGRAERGPGLIYSGVQIIKTERLHSVTEQSFSLKLVWSRMIKDRTLFALSYPGQWCDVGHPGGITLAEHMLEAPDV